VWVSVYISPWSVISVFLFLHEYRHSSVCTVTSYKGGMVEESVWFMAGTRDFSLLHSIQTKSGAHTSLYPVGTGGCFPRGKASGTWIWPLTSHLVLKLRMTELYLHSPTCSHSMVLNKYEDSFYLFTITWVCTYFSGKCYTCCLGINAYHISFFSNFNKIYRQNVDRDRDHSCYSHCFLVLVISFF
jgi:hypothetical protein